MDDNSATRATALPWRVQSILPSERDSVLEIRAGQNSLIGKIWGPRDDKQNACNAALIVRAVNSHDNLVAALEKIISRCDRSAPWADIKYIARTALEEAKP